MEFGWTSLLPPVMAIALAIITRRVLLSLGMAIVVGAVLLAPVSVGEGTWPERFAESVREGSFPRLFWQAMWQEHMWPALKDYDPQAGITTSDHLRVFFFSVTLGAMVGVIEAAGGMRVLIRQLTRRVTTRRGGQGLVWGLGLGVFFDDYANTLLLGTTMRSAADRLRFSRAKLAYLVDSTAAPVAGLAIVSTWVATEVSLIGDGLREAGVAEEISAFSVFLWSIPTRFYAWFALVMVAVIAFSGRDFGPMLREERQALAAGGGEDEISSAANEAGPSSHRPLPGWLWITAVVPVLVCVGVVLKVLVDSGSEGLAETSLSGLRYWGEVIGNADSYEALVWGSIAGLSTALLFGAVAAWVETGRWASGSRGLARGADFGVGVAHLFWGLLKGAGHIVPAMAILWLAWSLTSMTQGDFLGTGEYLAERLQQSGLPGAWLPTAVFVTSGFVALATGTSWGTMALLTPISVTLSVAAGEQLVGAEQAAASGGPLLVATVGAVLAGAIFGDHCSPISDTTVLSSRASGCDHILHVRTQLPYALTVGAVSILIGTLPGGFGMPAWASLTLGALVLIGGVWLLAPSTKRAAGQT